MSDIPLKPTYGQYLELDRILSSQHPVSDATGKPAHDELLFIIIHQAYELWFKQIIHDLGSVLDMFDRNFVDERNIGIAVSRLHRIVEIEKLMIEQIKVLETMTPLDFLDFRNLLTGASGFQSMQFRIVENRLGLRPDQRLKYAQRDYHAEYSSRERETVLATEQGPSLFDVIERWLERTPFLATSSFNFVDAYLKAFGRMVATQRAELDALSGLTDEEKSVRRKMSEHTEAYVRSILDERSYNELREKGAVRLSWRAYLAALFINLYRDQPILHLPFQLLSVVLEIDEYLNLWRYRHSLMVLRMIGARMGTGGSSGHDYLKQTVEQHRIFSDLFNLSTLLIPRSELPELPAELARDLGFCFTFRA